MKHIKFILPKMWEILGVLGIMLFSQFTIAQCTFLAFNDNVEIVVGPTCQVLITRDEVLENSTNCPDDVTVSLFTYNGVFIASGNNQALLPSGFAGTTIQVEVSHPNGLFGTTTASIVDNLSPTFSQCNNISISCTTPIDAAAMAAVAATDNCDTNVDISFSELPPFGPNCSGGAGLFVIIRNYTAVDNVGNEATCTQSILIEQPDLSDVVFPTDLTVACGASTDSTATGQPMLDGVILNNANDGACNFAVTKTDEVVDICLPGGFQILRTWNVHNWCTNTSISDTQVITVEDTVAPLITCPANQTVGTNAGMCTATIDLPLPTATDACSSITFSVNTSYGQTSFAPFTGVNKGNYSVTYKATDGCNNVSECTIDLTVVDLEEPIPVCDEITEVGLSTNGFAVVPANVFDDGSFDNCSSVSFSVKRPLTDFGPTVTFDCADVGNSVMVILRVSENANPNSFATCMVEVEVEDNVFPTLACPLNMTVDCDNDFSDLSVFGVPTVFENCGTPTILENSTINLSNCGTGNITRTFTVTDNVGNSNSCTQIITVDNQTPFDGNGNIAFAPDYTIENACIQPDQLDPDDLPTSPINYSMPVVNAGACAMIATSYTDQLFQISFPACYKIIRTWKVIDWCTYDPMNPAAGGIWTDQQVIKVIDTMAPVVTNCPTDITVGVSGNCQFGTVNVTSMTATDCSTNLTYTNNSNFATGNGANISGQYPLGIQNVTITVQDGCGNQSNCQLQITVADLSLPSPVCTDGIVVELQEMNGGIMAMVPVQLINSGVSDNCTVGSDLIVTIGLPGGTSPPTATMLTFDCDQIGNNFVQMWVQDASGNADFCQTNVEVQDNMNLCPETLVAGIQGEIETEMLESVEEVNVTISSNAAGLPDMTGLEGSYAVPNLPLGQTYTVVPEKNMEHGNGVTTFDLIKITKHILGTQLLDSPYKIIAADVNHSGEITTLDVVQMRKIILQIYDEFPSNTSWRFVDKNYIFNNPQNPFAEDFPEIVTIENLTEEGAESNFYGIKIGDLNNSAVANSLLGADDRSFDGELNFTIDNQLVTKGEMVEIAFKATDFNDITGFQFSLEFDDNQLEFMEMKAGELTDLTSDNFGFTQLDNGIVTSSWHTFGQPVLMDNSDAIFYMQFKALADTELKDIIRINSAATVAEGYNAAEELLDIRLQFDDASNTAKAFELLQNRPNPFAKSTEISFYLPKASEVNLTIFDVSGKVLKTYTDNFEIGHHKIMVQKADLPVTGVLYYRLETAEDTATRKMIVIQ